MSNEIPFRSYGSMNPNPNRERNVLFHPLARMLPLRQYQSQVYKLAEKIPQGFNDGWCPSWEVGTALLPARQTTQLRINFQREFHLFALMATSLQAGGFRAQLYDVKKRYTQDSKPGVRLAGRGVNFANYFGKGGDPFFLREPHPFNEPNAQCLIILQNQDTGGSSNEIQVALYGMVRRFNWPD